MEGSTVQARLDFGKMGYGCRHYRRRCRIRAPCCGEIFHCRHCHDESTKDHHEISRFAVERVICAICDTEQSVAQICSNCGIKMGEYFCAMCKFYDDDIEREQFHCDDCGICRIGGRENFFHCQKCAHEKNQRLSLSHRYFPARTCYSTDLRDKHACVENSMRHDCSICFEYLFDSIKETSVLKCGHTMHSNCLQEMLKHDKYCCPICTKSVTDMSNLWKKLDEEVEATEMPLDYRSRKVWILCNDCNDTTEVLYHIIGQKCSHCKSYNTRIISPPTIPQ